MNFFKKIFGDKSDTHSEVFTDEELVDAGVCPNCWGTQEFDNQYKEFVKDQTKANINHDASNQKAFVTQFVETHVTGVKLKRDGDYQTCPKCKLKYKYVSSKA